MTSPLPPSRDRHVIHSCLVDPLNSVIHTGMGKKSPGTRNEYRVDRTPRDHPGPNLTLATLVFQDGNPYTDGIPGLTHEDLLLVVIDRLQGSQETGNRCQENSIAITKLEEALMWLSSRTQERRMRGVEGEVTP